MSMKIKDIAKLAGVSVGTVSGVLNQSPKIKEETRLKVLNVIKETGYHPHSIARSLSSAKTKIISVCFYNTKYVETPFYTSVLGGILDITDARDYNLLINTTQTKPGNTMPNFIKPIIEKRIDGAIIYDDVIEDDVLIKLYQMGFPFVLINRKIKSYENIPTACADYREAIYKSTKYLIELGHKRIGLQLVRLNGYVDNERLAGYKGAIAEAGIEYDEKLISDEQEFHLNKRSKPSDTQNYINYILSLNDPATAIIFQDDDYAAFAIKYISDLGYNIPRDISIIGINDHAIAITTKPMLSTVRIRSNEMGTNAAKLLLNMLDNKDLSMRNIITPVELVIRESTARVNSR